MIKVILFDFHGVVSNDFVKKSEKDFCKKYKISNTRFIDKFKRAIKESVLNIDTGSNSEEIFFKSLILQLELKASLNEVKKFFKQADERNIQFRKGVLELIIKLKKEYTVGLATNVSRGLAIRLNKMKSYHVFEKNHRFISSDIGYSKPSKEFFGFILKKLNVKPKETIFIDDRKKFVEGAKNLGINGIVYKNIKQLKKDLHKYNTKF